MKDNIFLINFEKDDYADIMVNEKDEFILDENRVLNILQQEGLSLNKLNGSVATIQNFKKQLYIKLDSNNTVHSLSLLNFIKPSEFIELANTFLHPKKVKLSEVSPQIGGYIDKHSGIKFKIDIISLSAEYICEEDSQKKENQIQAKIYICSMLGISNENEEYSPSIEDLISKMKKFYLEGIEQIKYIEHDKNSDVFNILYRKGDIYFFAPYKGNYYASVSVEDKFLVYCLYNNEVQIICHAQSKNLLHSAIESYFVDFEKDICFLNAESPYFTKNESIN